MSLWRVLYAGPECWTVHIGSQVYELEVILILLAKSDSGCAASNRIHVELDRSVAERHVFQRRIAAVQSHQAVKKCQLVQELRVLLGLPVIGGHGDIDRFRGPGNRKCKQETGAERHPAKGHFADKSLHNSSVCAGLSFDELRVTRRT